MVLWSAKHFNLEAFILDELLQSVNDIDELVLVVIADVTGVEPALGVDTCPRRFWSVVVAGHHLAVVNDEVSF